MHRSVLATTHRQHTVNTLSTHCQHTRNTAAAARSMVCCRCVVDRVEECLQPRQPATTHHNTPPTPQHPHTTPQHSLNTVQHTICGTIFAKHRITPTYTLTRQTNIGIHLHVDSGLLCVVVHCTVLSSRMPGSTGDIPVNTPDSTFITHHNTPQASRSRAGRVP